MGIAVFAIVAMYHVPPWSGYQVHVRDPLEPIVNYELLPTYAWRDHPPFSRKQGHGYSINERLMLLQMLVVGLTGAGVCFGKRGLIGFGLPVAGGFLGIQAPLLVLGEPVAHTAGVPTAVYVIMAITGLIGLGMGLAIARSIIKSMPSEPRRRLASGENERHNLVRK